MYKLPLTLQKLVEELTQLPGVGYKSAMRMAFFYLKQPEERLHYIANLFDKLSASTLKCNQCFNLSNEETCEICKSDERDTSKILVIEKQIDLITIENANIYKGMYHVIQEILSPVNGVGVEDTTIPQLVTRVGQLHKKINNIEVIFGLSTNMQSDATIQFIMSEFEAKGLSKFINTSSLARGLPRGAEIDYADEYTLQQALNSRTSMT